MSSLKPQPVARISLTSPRTRQKRAVCKYVASNERRGVVLAFSPVFAWQCLSIDHNNQPRPNHNDCKLALELATDLS